MDFLRKSLSYGLSQSCPPAVAILWGLSQSVCKSPLDSALVLFFFFFFSVTVTDYAGKKVFFREEEGLFQF